jgi:hypothetical protein
MKEKTIGEVCDNIIQACCIFSYSEKNTFNSINDLFLNMEVLKNEILSVHKNYKTAVFYYHKIYRKNKNRLLEELSSENFEQCIKSLIIIGNLIYLYEENILINDISEKQTSNINKEMFSIIEYKLNKWNNLYIKEIQND